MYLFIVQVCEMMVLTLIKVADISQTDALMDTNFCATAKYLQWWFIGSRRVKVF